MWWLFYAILQLLPIILRKYVVHSMGGLFLPPVFSLFMIQSMIPSASRYRNPVLIIVVSSVTLLTWYFPSTASIFLYMSSFASPFVILLELVVINILFLLFGEFLAKKCHENNQNAFIWRVLTLFLSVISLICSIYLLLLGNSNSNNVKLLFGVFGIMACVHNVWNENGVILTACLAILWGSFIMCFDESIFSEFISSQFSWIIYGLFSWFEFKIFSKHFDSMYLSLLILRSFGMKVGFFNFTIFSFLCVVVSAVLLQMRE